jgi:putative DeoR family transcriptional regulator (stage III sporulation protein D)
MNKELSQIICSMAGHICQTHDTIRQTAKVYGLSKSTVHTYVSDKLKYIDIDLYNQTKKVLDENFSVKHLRGGEATRRKYAESENEIL